MSECNRAALIASYHQAEDYFFASISQKTCSIGNFASAYLTGVEAGSLNLLIIKQAGADISAVLQDGTCLFDDAGLPFTILLYETVLEQLADTMHDVGFVPAYNTVAMQLSMKDFLPKNSMNDSFEIDCTNQRLNDWALPLESAFESNPTLMMQYRLRHQAAIEAQKQFFHFSLYVKNRAACSLTLSINNGFARLDDIGTEADFQGQGYATALIQHALQHIDASTVSHCFLEASTQGASIYKKAGFSTLFSYAAVQRA